MKFSEGDSSPGMFFCASGKGWVPAGNLRTGEQVELYSEQCEEITAFKLESLTEPTLVYNFKVEDWHTYFVSEEKILVHNANYTYTPASSPYVSPTGLNVWVNKAGVPVKWVYTVGSNGTRGHRYYRETSVGPDMERGHVKSVAEGAQRNPIDDSALNVIEQTPTVNKKNVRAFEKWRIKHAQGAKVIVERLPNGYIRTQMPAQNIDVTYNPLSNVEFPKDWFLKGGTFY